MSAILADELISDSSAARCLLCDGQMLYDVMSIEGIVREFAGGVKQDVRSDAIRTATICVRDSPSKPRMGMQESGLRIASCLFPHHSRLPLSIGVRRLLLAIFAMKQFVQKGDGIVSRIVDVLNEPTFGRIGDPGGSNARKGNLEAFCGSKELPALL